MKYIDSEKLIAEIKAWRNKQMGFAWDAVNEVLEIVSSIQQEQPETSNNLVDVDAVREDFMTEVYRVLDADSTTDRANAIIDAFDSLPTVSQEQPEVDFEKEEFVGVAESPFAMTKEEEKKLLLKDLCARLPYGVKAKVVSNSLLFANYGDVITLDNFKEGKFLSGEHTLLFNEFKPYLRLISSITEKEVDFDLEDKTTLKDLNAEVEYDPDTQRIQTAEYVTMNDIRFGEHTNKYPPIDHCDMYKTIDWLNAHHFDYRNLIGMGLALEAPEGMYNG